MQSKYVETLQNQIGACLASFVSERTLFSVGRSPLRKLDASYICGIDLPACIHCSSDMRFGSDAVSEEPLTFIPKVLQSPVKCFPYINLQVSGCQTSHLLH
jgi:hypothetical protein